MSHKATVWALDQRSIKGTTKIVLWHLCDRYNPEHGCFPSQELLAYDCQVSRSGLNNHLGHLERCGLMRRERRIDPSTKRQMSTRYILGFETDSRPHQRLLLPKARQESHPKGKSRVQIPDTDIPPKN